jgi:hypothetical protein
MLERGCDVAGAAASVRAVECSDLRRIRASLLGGVSCCEQRRLVSGWLNHELYAMDERYYGIIIAALASGVKLVRVHYLVCPRAAEPRRSSDAGDSVLKAMRWS